MKKIFSFFIFLLTLSFHHCFAITVDDYNVTAQINSNGSVDIIENITYSFDEYVNGQFINLTYQNNTKHDASSISNLSVAVDGVLFEKVSDAINGQDKIYVITDDSHNLNLKVFMPSENEKKSCN